MIDGRLEKGDGRQEKRDRRRETGDVVMGNQGVPQPLKIISYIILSRHTTTSHKKMATPRRTSVSCLRVNDVLKRILTRVPTFVLLRKRINGNKKNYGSFRTEIDAFLMSTKIPSSYSIHTVLLCENKIKKCLRGARAQRWTLTAYRADLPPGRISLWLTTELMLTNRYFTLWVVLMN